MNTLMKAEEALLGAHRQLLEFSDELGRGVWSGRNSEAAMRAVEIGAEIRKGTALVFASEGVDGPLSPLLNLQ